MSRELQAGLLLVITPIAFNVIFLALGRVFDYPDILRRPTDEVLRRFADGGRRLVLLWYAFAAVTLLFLPIALLLGELTGADELGRASVPIGLIAGLVQLLGLLRWSFAVPALARAYVAPETSAAARDAIAVTFDWAHRYLGVAVGEHLGYLFSAVWTVLVALALTRTGLVPDLLALAGIVPALAILASLLEPAGWRPAGAVNAIGYIAWSLWLLVLGVAFILTAV